MKRLILLFAFMVGSINAVLGQQIQDPQNNPNKLSFMMVSNTNEATNSFVDNTSSTLQPSAESLEILNNITFGVVVGVFTYPIPIQSEFCKPIRDELIVTQTGDGYVYSVGAFKNYVDADHLLENLKKVGYGNAGVFSFYKSTPILNALNDIAISAKNQ